MENLGYYNGKIGLLEELCVPFNDRVHFFGDGVYDATCGRNHRIYALEEHIDRFYRSMAMLDIHLDMSKADLAALLRDLICKVDASDVFVYWQATRGTQIRAHAYPDGMPANLWVMIKPQNIKDVYTPIQAVTRPDTRFFHCNIKTLNLLPSVMYAKEAERLGVYETILYREPDRVTECAHSNVSILTHEGVFRTAPTDNLILPGIARANLLRACRALGIPTDETPFTLSELRNAAEIIISSSSAFCMVCNQLDGSPCGGGAPEQLNALRTYLVDDFMSKTE